MVLTEKELRVLTEFTYGDKKRLYGREISRKLKMNQKTVSNIFNKLEKKDIVKFSQEGKNKYYFINKLNPLIKDIVKMVEINKRIGFFEKYKKLNSLFMEIEKRSKGIVIIFGSYSNFSSNEKSDLDIFVIGSISELNDLEKLYNIKINVVKSTKDKFKINDTFIIEILKNHILLKGVEEFIELTWQV